MFATSKTARRIACLASLLLPLAAQAGPRLMTIVGWPFEFPDLAGHYQVATVSPDGTLLVLSSAGTPNALASFRLDVNGAPSPVGWFPSMAAAGTLGSLAFVGPDQLFVVGKDVLNFHHVVPTGEVPYGRSWPMGVTTGRTRQGMVSYAFDIGTFLAATDDLAPNTLSIYGWTVRTWPYFLGAIPTGGDGAGLSDPEAPAAASRIAKGGDRIFVLNSGMPGAFEATLGVFDVVRGLPVAVAGSPFQLGASPSGIAVTPSGDTLFVGGTEGNVLRYQIGPDGAPAFTNGTATWGAVGPIAGMAVDPTGRWLAYADPAACQLVVADAATLAPIERGWINFLCPPDSDEWIPSGVAWDGAGRLYLTHAGVHATVSVFEVIEAVPQGVSCRGTPTEPVVLLPEPGTCWATVDVGSGVVGGCTPEGGEIAACTFVGLPDGRVQTGLTTVDVVKTFASGRKVYCESYVLVPDATLPAVTVSAQPSVLWPPDGRLVPVALSVEAVDACFGPMPFTCAATSSDPEDGLDPDVVWSGDQLWLRAERSSPGHGRGHGHGPDAGRTYTVTCTSTDYHGNVGTGSAAVVVPRRRP